MADTIAAISTAPGESGIGIVRVSGPASLEIMRKIMGKCPEEIIPRHMYLSSAMRKREGGGEIREAIDRALFVYMKAPFSYTGEDMLEIQAHGSKISLRNILKAVFDLARDAEPGTDAANIRMAEPGEFTKLAFLNGKMDLSQAEAVIDIIQAGSDISLEIAESQHAGRLSAVVREIREALLDILAEMAVGIDYPDEDYEFDDEESNSELIGRIRWVLSDVEDLLGTADIGRIAREGVRLVIVGKPNAGKSSLMNAILGEGRVIVTDVPGTTRDTVEESASIGGVPIVLVDTAGIRETGDKVERIGVERTTQAIASADIVLLVLDGSRGLDDEDNMVLGYIEHMNTDHMLVLINKEDLGSSISEETVKDRLPDVRIIRTSLIGRGASEAARRVSAAIEEILEIGSINTQEMSIVTNERHVQMLKNAVMNLDEAISMLRNGEPLEVAELSVHYAYDSLGKIIGEEVGDEILNTVFSRFCLGK